MMTQGPQRVAFVTVFLAKQCPFAVKWVVKINPACYSSTIGPEKAHKCTHSQAVVEQYINQSSFCSPFDLVMKKDRNLTMDMCKNVNV